MLKKPFIILGLLFTILVVTIGVFFFSQNDTLLVPLINTSPNTADVTVMSPTQTNSRYVNYTTESFAAAVDNRRLLFFYASWCPTCRPADLDIQANIGRIPTNLSVIRVNYNDPDTDQSEKDLATKYGVTYQHTFVQIDSTGQEVTRWNGGKFADLLSKVK